MLQLVLAIPLKVVAELSVLIVRPLQMAAPFYIAIVLHPVCGESFAIMHCLNLDDSQCFGALQLCYYKSLIR